jgi:hypothetical protein
MKKHKTARGREFNMQAFSTDRGETVAVGNVMRNARGDLLGAGGKVIATQQQITNVHYNQSSAKGKTKQVKLNPLEQEVSRTEVMGADGVARWEITYADGSVEVQAMEEQPSTVVEQEPDVDPVEESSSTDFTIDDFKE